MKEIENPRTVSGLIMSDLPDSIRESVVLIGSLRLGVNQDSSDIDWMIRDGDALLGLIAAVPSLAKTGLSAHPATETGVPSFAWIVRLTAWDWPMELKVAHDAQFFARHKSEYDRALACTSLAQRRSLKAASHCKRCFYAALGFGDFSICRDVRASDMSRETEES